MSEDSHLSKSATENGSILALLSLQNGSAVEIPPHTTTSTTQDWLHIVKESLDSQSSLWKQLIHEECFLVLQKSKDFLLLNVETLQNEKHHLAYELRNHASHLKNSAGKSLCEYNQELQKLFAWQQHIIATKLEDSSQNSKKLLPKKRWKTQPTIEDVSTIHPPFQPAEMESDDDSNDETYVAANDFRRMEEQKSPTKVTKLVGKSPTTTKKKPLRKKRRFRATSSDDEEEEAEEITSPTRPTKSKLEKSISDDDSNDENYHSKIEAKSRNVLLPQVRKINLLATEVFLSHLLPIKLLMWTKPFNNTTIEAKIVSVTFDESSTKNSNFLSIIVQYPVDSNIYWASVSGAANEMLIDARGGKLRNSAIKDNRVKNSINGFIDCKVLNVEGRKLKKSVALQPAHVLRLEDLFSKEVRTGEDRIDWTKLISKAENPELYQKLFCIKNELDSHLKKLGVSVEEEQIHEMLRRNMGTKCISVQPRRGFLTTEERIQLGLKHKNWSGATTESATAPSSGTNEVPTTTIMVEDGKEFEEEEEEIQILDEEEDTEMTHTNTSQPSQPSTVVL